MSERTSPRGDGSDAAAPTPATAPAEDPANVPTEGTDSTPTQGADSTDSTPTQGADSTDSTPTQGADSTDSTPTQGAGTASVQPGPRSDLAAPRSVTERLADRLDNDGFFAALFDITFTRFVTRKLAGPVYIVGLTLIALGFVLAFITSISAAIVTGTFWGVLLFLLDLLLSVVGATLAILLLRVGIEVFVAVVAIAENTRPRDRDETHLPDA